MATQAPTNLPLLYRGLAPLNRQDHGDKKVRRLDTIAGINEAHAVPVTVDEFMLAGRFFPIIFSTGEQSIPLALMGLHEGANTFFDAEGKLLDDAVYVPAYLRRYPFMLARLTEATDQLSLCFDPTSGAVGDEGDALFDGDEPSDRVLAWPFSACASLIDDDGLFGARAGEIDRSAGVRGTGR